MITVCLLVAGALQCATLTGPQPTPAQAAAILAPGQYVAPPVARPVGPTSVVIASSVTAGPFGEFAPYTPPRPLNQTPGAYDPVVAYGGPVPWVVDSRRDRGPSRERGRR